MNLSQISEVKNLVERASSALIILSPKADFDQQLAASSLYLYLKNMYSQARFELLSPKKVSNNTIAGLDQLKTKMGKKNLLVSFDYDESAVGKVSYHIDEDNKKFYLTIKPKKGQKPLDKESVKLDYVGSEADLIFFVGVSSYEELDHLYYGYEDLYENTTNVCISETELTQVGYYHNPTDFSSYSEAVYAILENWNGGLDSTTATNLLAGIQYHTDNFVSLEADADTFERVAKLIRAGARRTGKSFKKHKKKTSSNTDTNSNSEQEEESSRGTTPTKKGENKVFESSLKDKKKTTVVMPSGLKK